MLFLPPAQEQDCHKQHQQAAADGQGDEQGADGGPVQQSDLPLGGPLQHQVAAVQLALHHLPAAILLPDGRLRVVGVVFIGSRLFAARTQCSLHFHGNGRRSLC